MRNAVLATSLALLVAMPAVAGESNGQTYEVTVTNVTKGQTFTPILAAAHRQSIAFFEPGTAALPELATLAEGGDTAPLGALLTSLPSEVGATAGTPGVLLGPGESVSFEILANGRFDRLSLAAMLIPTNDTFVAVDSVPLPSTSSTVHAYAYDAGSEANDESCAHIPGPVCGGAGASPGEGGEGYVHLSSGIHGIGDLGPETYDWRGPVAEVRIRHMASRP